MPADVRMLIGSALTFVFLMVLLASPPGWYPVLVPILWAVLAAWFGYCAAAYRRRRSLVDRILAEHGGQGAELDHDAGPGGASSKVAPGPVIRVRKVIVMAVKKVKGQVSAKNAAAAAAAAHRKAKIKAARKGKGPAPEYSEQAPRGLLRRLLG